MKIVVIGTGYVGLVAGACFSDFGLNVTCVDTQESKIEDIKNGFMLIFEHGLEEIVVKNYSETKMLSFTTSLEEALVNADVAFIAVGTPPRPHDGHADMKYVHAVAREIGECAKNDLVVVNKSTVPVGTGDDVEKILRQANQSVKFSVVSNPEFLREGIAIDDFKKPDRIVIGFEEDWAGNKVKEIYQNQGFGDAPILSTSRRSAELIKYAANAFLATKIMFTNEMCDLCEATGGDIADVAKGMGLDTRIGEKFLKTGPGYGGSCFPKDTLAIAKTARDHRVNLDVIETVIRSNENRKQDMAWKIFDALGGDVESKTVAVLGLTFKADTDDMRASPAISIVQSLLDRGMNVQAYDPEGMENARKIMPNIRYCENALAATSGADVIAIVTEWQEFAELDLVELRQNMYTGSPIFVDYRNLFDPEKVKAAVMFYDGVGYVAGTKRL